MNEDRPANNRNAQNNKGSGKETAAANQDARKGISLREMKGNKLKKGKSHGKPGKRKKKPGIVFMISLVILILIGGTAVFMYYTGRLNPILESLGATKTVNEPTMSVTELNAWELKLNLREIQLADRKKELDEKEQELADKERELNVKDNNLKIFNSSGTDQQQHQADYTQTFQEMLNSLTDEEISYYKRMSVVYSKMDPATAATDIVQLYDMQKTAAIIYYMLPASSAKIFEKMDQATASKITEIILN